MSPNWWARSTKTAALRRQRVLLHPLSEALSDSQKAPVQLAEGRLVNGLFNGQTINRSIAVWSVGKGKERKGWGGGLSPDIRLPRHSSRTRATGVSPPSLAVSCCVVVVSIRSQDSQRKKEWHMCLTRPATVLRLCPHRPRIIATCDTGRT